MAASLSRTAASAAQRASQETGIVIQLVWRHEVKQWRIVASLHTGKGVRVLTRDVDWTGAPDVDDLRRLVTSIQRECESWLW